MDFTRHFALRLRRDEAPQTEALPGSTQVQNSAGGYAWQVDRWTRLDRFLVLGSEGGTYYSGERALTRENAGNVLACIAEDGLRVVRRTVQMSQAGRAPKNDPALFILALAATAGDDATRTAAFWALPGVARTGTHLFRWMQYIRGLRGWGRGVRRAVGRWYTAKPAQALAHQVLKYRARDGWTHRDALRLAHPVPPTPLHDMLFRYVTQGWEAMGDVVSGGPVAATIDAVRGLGRLEPDAAAMIIREQGLVREMVPTHLLSHAVVWDALLERMPLTALMRNLGVMSKVGLLVAGSDAARSAVARLGDREALWRARVHPVHALAALETYAAGHGVKGHGTWVPVAAVVDALDSAFYLAFGAVVPTRKRMLLALDVSASMGASVFGLDTLSCRQASAAMALVTAAAEPNHEFVAFTQGAYPGRWTAQYGSAWNSGLTSLTISPRQRLDDVLRTVTDLPWGGTDCALPMIEALKHRWLVDAFVVYTDNETWAGNVHPARALREYRDRMGIPAKLIVVGMASNGFSVADPDDAGMLDVVGFDAATPQVLSDFIA